MATTYVTNIGTAARGATSGIRLATGATIPQLGFGTYQIPAEKVASAVTTALEAGFRHLDCAPVYQNQEAVGAALSAAFANGLNATSSSNKGGNPRRTALRRDDVFVTSKLWCTDQHPDDVEAACRRSLDQLQTSYLDLYLMHWPICWRHPKQYQSREDWFPITDGCAQVDATVAITDTWKAMEQLVKKGLVKAIGVSNCNAEHLAAIDEISTVPCVANQVERHPGLQQTALHNVHLSHQMVTCAYCPLGPPTRFTPAGFGGVYQHTFFKPLCELTGFSPARLLLNWGLDYNTVVICRSTNEDHIRDNAKAQKGALSESTRWMMNSFESAIGTIRVLNPTAFTAQKDRPFFPEAAAARQ